MTDSEAVSRVISASADTSDMTRQHAALRRVLSGQAGTRPPVIGRLFNRGDPWPG